jgi:hypothetical protein
MKLLSPSWPVFMLLLNVVATASVVTTLVKLCLEVTRSRIAAWSIVGMCFAGYDFYVGTAAVFTR